MLAVMNDSLPWRTVDIACNVCESREDVGAGTMVVVLDGDSDNDMTEVELAEIFEVELATAKGVFGRMDEDVADVEKCVAKIDAPLADEVVEARTVLFAPNVPCCKLSKDEAAANIACEHRQ